MMEHHKRKNDLTWSTTKGRMTELERDERKTEFELDRNWTGIGQEL